MAPGCFLDTSVLLDAVNAAPVERTKRDLARELLQEDGWTLSIQVLRAANHLGAASASP